MVSIQPGASTCNMSIDRVERFFQLGPDGKPTSAVAVARPGGCFTIADFEKIA